MSDTAEDWAEKYRPKTLTEILGNPGAAEQIRNWAMKWKEGKPSPRALVLIGSPGIGKTSAAHALAKDMGWSVVEMNASEQRNADAITNIALRASRYSTFSDDGAFMDATQGEMKLIILDEADCLYGNSDRGAMPVITELVKTASQPVILIANDGYALNKKSSSLKDNTLQITFRKPTAAAVSKVIRNVCAGEGVSIDDDAVLKIAENAGGDIRAAVRDLQSLASAHPHVTIEDTVVLSGREARSEIYDVVSAVYRRRDPALARQYLAQADTDPDNLILWLAENMPYECHSSGDLVRVAERLARADVYLGRVHKRMNYAFRSYAVDMMLNGVPDALKSKEITHDRIRFPNYLSRMSRTKSTRALRASAAAKIAAAMHTSSSRILNDILPQLRVLLENDAEMRRMYAKDIGLEPEELAFVLGVAPDKKIVKDAYAEPKPEKTAKTTRKKKTEAPSVATETSTVNVSVAAPEPKPVVQEVKAPEPVAVPEPVAAPEPAPVEEKPVQPEPEKPKKQRSLFDFQ